MLYYPIKQPFLVTLPETSGDFAKCRLFSQARFIRVYILSFSCANGIFFVFWYTEFLTLIKKW